MKPYFQDDAVLLGRGDMVVRDACGISDKSYLQWLSKQESYALGWIPEQLYERICGCRLPRFTGSLLMVEANADPVGFLVGGWQPAGSKGRIYQLAVQSDARRFQYATTPVDAFEDILPANVGLISLRCAADLPSNHFWGILGFTVTAVVAPGSPVGDSPRRTKRPLNVRQRPRSAVTHMSQSVMAL